VTLRFEQMVALQQLLETMEWREAVEDWDTENQRRIAETASFFSIGFCGSMRGFELPRALLTNLMHTIHLEERQCGHRHHVGIFFLGRFKVRSNAEKEILVFLWSVSASGLQPGLWVSCLDQSLESLGILSGWLFQGLHGDQRPRCPPSAKNSIASFLPFVMKNPPSLNLQWI
jgi:hypothetical protein